MTVQISKFLAKQFVKGYAERNKTKDTKHRVLSSSLNLFELWDDLLVYVVLFLIVYILLLIGAPIAAWFITNTIGWSFVAFFMTFFAGIIFAFRVIRKVALYAKAEVSILLDIP